MSYHHSNGGAGIADAGSHRGYSGDERESRSGGEDGGSVGRNDESEMLLHDKPTYLLEHLATFTVNKDAGIVYPADGMRRLLQLEKTTGIWSQKMQLCLDYRWVLIMDFETGNIIERFPASLIQEPTAFTSTDAMELYNNILVFIVSGGNGARCEMHIFQSQSVSAVHLVEDLKNLQRGNFHLQQREVTALQSVSHHIQQPQQQQTMPHVTHSHSQQVYMDSNSNSGGLNKAIHTGHYPQRTVNRDQHAYGMRVAGGSADNEQIGVGLAETDPDIGGDHESRALGGGINLNEETSSVSSDKYERDVNVLNHCFDDIEKFIARLQHAAAASRELERRRRNRKSKKKDPGEGLLTLRTRPPHEKEFIDIFAKFKLSFNLLAKLKAHIHDPNAPELVHFLFTPLALIVEAASDTYYESQLPSRVVNPLLTREAVNLLINCVTSKETELWRSLGDAWTVPRDQWKEDVGSYHPVFLDGWSPEYLIIDELEKPATMTPPPPVLTSGNNKRSHNDNGRDVALAGNSGGTDTHDNTNISYDDYDGSNKYMLENSIDAHERHSGSSDHIHQQHTGKNHQNVAGVMSTSGGADALGMQAITAGFQNIYAREMRSSNNASMDYQTNSSSPTGHHPMETASSGIRTGDDEMIEQWLEDLQTADAKIVLVTYPRTANNDKELSVVRGEYLEILDDSRKWWKARNIRGQMGHVPHTIVTPYNEAVPRTLNNLYGHHQQTSNFTKPRNSSTSENFDIRASTNGNADWIRNKHLGTHSSSQQKQIKSKFVQQSSQPPSNRFEAPAPTINGMEVSDSTIYSKIIKTNASNTSSSTGNLENLYKSMPLTNGEKVMQGETMTSLLDARGISSSPTSSSFLIHNELKQVFTQRERRNDLDIHKTLTIYIEQKSSPKEVLAWLRAKEFSPFIIERLKGLDAEELFALKRERILEICGNKEGKRLASQIDLQKSVSGYKTARSSELHAVLAKARPKSEINV